MGMHSNTLLVLHPLLMGQYCVYTAALDSFHMGRLLCGNHGTLLAPLSLQEGQPHVSTQ